MRIGHGYDVHRLVAGRALILGGVTIPYEMGLLGHSDADVVVHAIMDSLIGAMGLGDIGKHFPDSDQKYLDISSILLLEHTKKLMDLKGYTVGNIDATIVAQSPKLAPYIGEMIENVAKALACHKDCINIKATTTEGLSFEGEKKGISAHSVCVILK